MATETLTYYDPIAPSDDELEQLRTLLCVLEEIDGSLTILDSDREPTAVPASAARVFRAIVKLMARDQAIRIDWLPKLVPLSVAAELLRLPRQDLARLLDDGQIPFQDRDGYQFIQFDDLMAYKVILRAQRREGLNEIARMSQEMGLYDLTPQDVAALMAQDSPDE